MLREEFESIVEGALSDLPDEFKDRMDNIAVIVEDMPPQEVYKKTGTSPYNLILGTYHGIPYQHRGPFYGNIQPDVIVIYQKSIEHICRTEEEIRDKVIEVVIHEIGHYFGFSDKELRELEAEHKKNRI
ncbi:metallopeptidase family protein [Acidobacteriota bacterium]